MGCAVLPAAPLLKLKIASALPPRQYPDVTAHSASYNRAYALAHEVAPDDPLFDAVLKLLSPQPGWRVLDVGCNTGALTSRLAAVGCRVIGLDINADAIAVARQRHPTLEFQVGTIEAVAPASFRAVVASHLIEHMASVLEFFDAARRALQPGGTLVLATPNGHAWTHRIAHWLWGVSFFDDPTHQRFYTAVELRRLLQAAGFVKIVTTTRRLYLPLAARLPARWHWALPACGMGDHLLARAESVSK